MYVDFTDLNKACPKVSYPLLNIDFLINEASGYQLLGFMDAYFGYNQFKLHPIVEQSNYCYKVIPFDLKNDDMTYQFLMDKILAKLIGRNVQVYVNDMVITSLEVNHHIIDLQEVFYTLDQYQLKLNPEKCSFGVQPGKFLGFMLTI